MQYWAVSIRISPCRYWQTGSWDRYLTRFFHIQRHIRHRWLYFAYRWDGYPTNMPRLCGFSSN